MEVGSCRCDRWAMCPPTHVTTSCRLWPRRTHASPPRHTLNAIELIFYKHANPAQVMAPTTVRRPTTNNNNENDNITTTPHTHKK